MIRKKIEKKTPSFHSKCTNFNTTITGNEAHYSILKQIQLVHLDDVCDAQIFLFEHAEATGRYICSSHDTTIYDLARMIKARYPEYDIPEKFEGIDEDIKQVHFSSKKLLELGFKFRYTAEDMFDAAIQTCREKKLIPMTKSAKSCAAADGETVDG